MRHDLLTLELLLAVAQSRSITKGAETVHLALASASKRVADLEARLGVPLFVRKARGCETTPACRSLLKHLRVVRDGLQAFDLEAAKFSQGVKGHVRLMVASDVAADGLPGTIAKFGVKHPDVHVAMSDSRGSCVESAILNGEADVAVFLQPLYGTELQTRTLGSGRWVAIVPGGHPLHRRARVSFRELLTFGVIGSDPSGTLMQLMQRAAMACDAELEPRFHAETFDRIAALVAAGAGVALVPAAVASRLSDTLPILDIPLHDDWAEYELVLGVTPHHPMPIPVERLVKAIEAGMPKPAARARAA